MAEITNIYVTCGYHGADIDNHVLLKVVNNGEILFIESTYHGYTQLDHLGKDLAFILFDTIYKEKFVDLMKSETKAYQIYNMGLNEAIFIDAIAPSSKFSFRQPVFIRKNSSLGTNHIFGGSGIEASSLNNQVKQTNKITTKKELINNIAKELKVCFPELKIKTNKTNKNINQ